MLLILERHELTVTELCAVLQLPQSTVSRHLKTLADTSWVTSRRDGTSRYYTLALDERDVAHPPALVAAARADRDDGRGGPGCAAAEGGPRPPAEQVRGVLRVGGGAVGSAPPRAVRRRARRCTRCRRWSTRAGRSAISAAAPARPAPRSRRLSRRRSRSIAAARCCRPRAAGCATCRTSTSGAASSRRCRSPTASSTPPS